MKRFVLSFALAVGLLASASTAMAQVNMSRYITLTVTNGAAIKLDFAAASAGTPVRIVSGSNTQNITVGTGWYNGNSPSTYTVTAGASTMTVYGDIIAFRCDNNGANLTALDPSHNTELWLLSCQFNQLTSLDVSKNTELEGLNCVNNKLNSLDISKNTQLEELYCHSNQLTSLDVSKNTQLEKLWCQNNNLTTLDVSKNTQLEELFCSDNKFTTATLDDIYCALPDRRGDTNGKIQPVHNSSSSNHATVLATNAQNAIAKNWKVQYYQNDTDIPTTTGTHVCGTPYPEPNMSRYITLTVKKDSAIMLEFKAAAAGTPVRIVSGSNTQDITVGTDWTGTASYTAGSTTMTVYGDIIGFDCNGNGAKLTALNVSQNTQLTYLDCSYNPLGSLDISKNTQLMKLICSNNRLTSLDVSKNTQLEILDCSSNQLTSLDVSKNTQLQKLYCYDNTLTSLDVSKNTQLTKLNCYDNNFTTAALDDIYCALPDRTGKEYGVIYPVYNFSSSNHATVLATNAANATAKNWKVQYSNGNVDITTTGSYVCGTPHIEPNMSRYITLTVTNGQAIRLDFKAAAAATPVRIVSGSNTQDITVGTSWTGFSSYTADGTTMTVYGDLTGFDCSKNGENLTALDASNNTQLMGLFCGNNNLSSLDVSKNTKLTDLSCFNNKLSNLDLSKNTELFLLNCNDNKLTSLDISKKSKLKMLYCYDNNFSTQALDDIYCTLPLRQASDLAVIYPIYSASSSYNDTVIATNAQNATDKNWMVKYYQDGTDIPTTGKHKCSATDIAEATAEQALTLYPNPVTDMLYLSATARTIRVYDIYGTEVAHAYDTDKVEVSHLPAGIYTVKADGTVAKMVKR